MYEQRIYQPLCSKVSYEGRELIFFAGKGYPRDLSKDNRFSDYIPDGCEFKVHRILFFVDGKGTNSRVLDHMIKYGYFIFRICDRDYLISPCMIMDRHERTLNLGLMIPIVIPSLMSYMVMLRFSKDIKYTTDIMCVLDGELNRKGV